MARLYRTLFAVGLAGVAAGLGGFVMFADAVRRLEPLATAKADAIVVLTGDEERISTGMRLMEAGRARRLLISGVHPTTRVPTELRRHIRGSEQLVRCCVDIGHDALNTSGNAEEARQWAVPRGFRSLIVVTSSYHMPRSLAEFERAMPGIALIGHPAMSSRYVRLDAWWQHMPTMRLLAGEYVKFLGASARLVLARLVDGGGGAAPPARQPAPETEEPARTIGAVR